MEDPAKAPMVGSFEHADWINRRRVAAMTPEQRAESLRDLEKMAKRCAPQVFDKLQRLKSEVPKAGD